MAGFIESVDRGQTTLFPERLEDWVGDDHVVRVVDLFEELDLTAMGFARASAARTGRPGYHRAMLLKLFIYGYLNHVPSSRRLEREARRNVELMWLTGRLVPDHKTIADFRRDNGPAMRRTCAQFVELCRRIGVLHRACVAIRRSKGGYHDRSSQNLTTLQSHPPAGAPCRPAPCCIILLGRVAGNSALPANVQDDKPA